MVLASVSPGMDRNGGAVLSKRRMSVFHCLFSVLCILSATSVILCVGYNGALAYSLKQVQPQTPLVPESVGFDPFSNDSLPSEPLFDAEGTPILSDTRDVTNILLIGTDGSTPEEYCRSDAMLLLSVNRRTRRIVCSSLLRDCYVALEGHENNRLNIAYSIGGAEFLLSTLRKNFNLDVSYYITVDFSSFAEIVDILGGVELEISPQEARVMNDIISNMNSSLGKQIPLVPERQGSTCLNGYQALAYARDRTSANGDFDRTRRQRTLIHTLMNKVKDASFPQLIRLLDRVVPYVTTNISLSLFKALLAEMGEYSSYEWVFQSVPVQGSFSFQTIRNMAVITLDFKKNTDHLYQTIYF